MRKSHGFTLIETLVGLTIIAVLAVGAYTVWQRPVANNGGTTTPVGIASESSPTTAPSDSDRHTTSTDTTTNPEGKIAFVRDGDVWLINADGSGEERIVNLPEKSYVPNPILNLPEARQVIKWSSNGKKLLFLKLTATPSQVLSIHTYNLETRQISRVNPGGIATDRVPKINEVHDFFMHVDDNCTLTGVLGEFESEYALYEYSVCQGKNGVVSTSGKVELGERGHAVEYDPATNQGYILTGQDNDFQILATKFNGASKEILYRGTGRLPAITYSLVTKELAFKNNANLHSLNVATGEVRLLTTDGNGDTIVYSDPRWSHNGKYLGYNVRGLDFGGIGFMRADGSDNRTLFAKDFGPVENSFIGTTFAAVAPPSVIFGAWSKDSNAFVVTYHHGNQKLDKDLRIYQLASGKDLLLTTNASQPAWQP